MQRVVMRSMCLLVVLGGIGCGSDEVMFPENPMPPPPPDAVMGADPSNSSDSDNLPSLPPVPQD